MFSPSAAASTSPSPSNGVVKGSSTPRSLSIKGKEGVELCPSISSCCFKPGDYSERVRGRANLSPARPLPVEIESQVGTACCKRAGRNIDNSPPEDYFAHVLNL